MSISFYVLVSISSLNSSLLILSQEMIFHLFPISILSFLLIFARLSTSLLDETELYANCSKPFPCSNIQTIGYPFWGGDRSEYCGHPDFKLTCENQNYPQMTIQSDTYHVLSIDNTTNSLSLVRSEFSDTFCPSKPSNVTINTPYLKDSSSSEYMTLFYGCPALKPSTPNQFECLVGGLNTTGYYHTSSGVPTIFNIDLGLCSTSVLVQVKSASAKALSSSPPSINISTALKSGFELVWDVNKSDCEKCARSGGVCGSNPSSKSFSFVCFCLDKAYNVSCGDDGNGKESGNENGTGKDRKKSNLAIFVTGALAGCFLLAFAIFIIFACRKRRNRMVPKSVEFGETKTANSSHLSKSLGTTATTSSSSFSPRTPSFTSIKSDTNASSYFGVKVFNYSELEEATDNFNPSREVGDGGFGTVFYGKLDDGREVAVKRLYENNFKRVTQYMNEVEILTRLSHTNLVKLYGCTSRRSKELLLVYEYIPNGTVADHLHGKLANSSLLTWPIRLDIALETAEALVYLHKSEIIHRDIKTTNILLDNDFCVKVADFGLSRLFPNNVTHVSTNPQGTPGYVDPEYHRCYHLTEKSDVYSFGVVLVELISSKQAVDITRHRHDINLANMAINKIQTGKLDELVDFSLGYGKNSSIKWMINSVAELAFQCLQNERDMRPPMEEILSGLKRIKNNGSATKVEEVNIVISDEAALLKNSSPPISPNSVIGNKWVSNATTPNNSR